VSSASVQLESSECTEENDRVAVSRATLTVRSDASEAGSSDVSSRFAAVSSSLTVRARASSYSVVDSPTRRCRQLVLKHEVTTATELKMETAQRWMRDSIRKVRKRIAPRDTLSRCCAMSLALQVIN
jgi:hypothetical protein